jgi:lysophospholipase L1-like esterase
MIAMRHRRSFATHFAAALLLAGACAAAVPAAESPSPPDRQSLVAGLDVLVIGDSNTEIGHVTGGLSKIFEERHGYFGSGYHSLNDTIGMGSGYLPYLSIENVGRWQKLAMVQPGAPKPYAAPDGSFVIGDEAGAHTDVRFWGDGVTVYWLADGAGGDFTAAVDGGEPRVIPTQAAKRGVQQTRLDGFAVGWHTLVLTVTHPKVAILGVAADVDAAGGRPRAVVNKWGKGWATTADFLDVDPTVFHEALGLLGPDVTVIMLGTNDHNLKGLNRDQFAANLGAIIDRVHAAVPSTRVLVVSTIQVSSGWSNAGLAHYVKILPEVCTRHGAAFWDMSTWFGPWAASNTSGLMADGVHVNASGGAKIAARLDEEIATVARAARPTAAAPAPDGREVGSPPQGRVPEGCIARWSAAGRMVVDDAGRLMRWIDASGRGADATAAWPWSRPEFVADAGDGRPVLRFDGKRAYLSFPMLTEAKTLVAVFRAPHLVLGHPEFNTRPFSAGVVRPGKAFSANYAAKAVTGGRGFLDGRPVHVGDDRDDAVAFDPKTMQVFSLVMAQPVPFSILGWGGSWNHDRYLQGDVAEILVFDRDLGDEERQSLERDLCGRWAVLRGP